MSEIQDEVPGRFEFAGHAREKLVIAKILYRQLGAQAFVSPSSAAAH